MQQYAIVLTILGIAILGVAWLPSLLARYPLSYPVVFIGLGILVYWLPLGLPVPNPFEYPRLASHLTELCVIVALTGTGLKIDQRFSFRRWAVPLRLASLAMVLSIAALAVGAWFLAGLPLASALLLSAALAPTDPVLAGDVQVGEPGEGKEDTVRFALTGEAGLNDGLAFPFVHLALTLLLATSALSKEITHWLLEAVLYKIAVGVGIGWLMGRGLSYLIFNLPTKISIKKSAYGFVALAVTFTTYGATELLQGYGFLAVFVAAITLRRHERSHEYHSEMHDFSDQVERLFIIVLLVLFGGALVNGILQPLTWPGVAVGLLFLFVIRPLAGMAALVNTNAKLNEKWVIAGFGIRGIGSFFYLAYGLEQADFPKAEQLWAIVSFVVLVSVIMHGILATPVMKWLDKQHNR